MTPIVVGSVWTTVYSVSGNSVSNLGEIKTSRIWEQSYAALNPHLVRSSSAWEQWRSEIKKVLNIAPPLQVDNFMCASGGNSFTVTLKDGETVSVEENQGKIKNTVKTVIILNLDFLVKRFFVYFSSFFWIFWLL
ncbi:hypothetical protein [Mesomycoplasma hyopneumoniae]|uniref:hypothetical protein n=1 Tax=Mesomycoplasma hyopneumoniae TaxID=2099 RepID=UPI001F264631|nr:hypothetical protein [Mesomycoplasma hyopneumoniae]